MSVRTARVVLAAALVAAAVFAPLLLFGSVVQGRLSADIAARDASERRVTARTAAALIDRELGHAGDDLVLLSTRSTLRDALRASDRAALERGLEHLRANGIFASSLALDAAGVMLARQPASPELYGQSFADRDYYRGALATSGPYVSDAFISRADGHPVYVAVALAVRAGGTTLGVIQGTIEPAQLLDLLAPLRRVAGREMMIVDSESRVVATTGSTLRPLAVVGLPPAATSTQPVPLEGSQRTVTTGTVGMARWTLYVIDDPAVVMAGERHLSRDLRIGGVGGGLLGLLAGAAVLFLYARTERQRDELRAGRAALAESNGALQEASRHKSDFLASMSHELRTPLNAILGFSDLLAEQLSATLTDRQARYLRNIKDAGSHLLGLINDVLDLSKVEAGRLDLRPERTTLEAVTAGILPSTLAAAQARGVAFTSDLPARLEATMDPARVRQILYNLLSNAVKFTPPGGRVTLTARAAGRDLELEVADTGIGIPEDKKDRVFGTFERLHEGRSDASGTGLGLALTKRLVELHGGTIHFTSAEGTGTTFAVRLPGVVAERPQGDRVLVVEDDPRDAELVVALAAKAGLEGEVVTSVAAALDALRRSAPIAIVLDLRLRGERGEGLLDALRSEPIGRDVPVIVVSVEDDEGRSGLLGADAHLTKPIDPARLTALFERAAARARRSLPGDAREIPAGDEGSRSAG